MLGILTETRSRPLDQRIRTLAERFRSQPANELPSDGTFAGLPGGQAGIRARNFS